MKLLIAIFLATFLYASSNGYPTLYKQLATPLYEATNSFEKLHKYDAITQHITDYKQNTQKVLALGQEAQASKNKKQAAQYLHALRDLQKQYDMIVKFSITQLQNTIKQDNYEEFTLLSDIGINYYKQKSFLKDKILAYYKTNKAKQSILALDKLIAYDAKEVIYASTNSNNTFSTQETGTNAKTEKEEIIVLTSPNCSYCKKLKALFATNQIEYTEYPTSTQKGSELFKKHKGRGVPMTIIGDKVLRGFNADKLLAAVGKR